MLYKISDDIEFWYDDVKFTLEEFEQAYYHVSERLNPYLHRIDGPAYVKKSSNCEIWIIHGKFHREDGPAIIQDDQIGWYLNNKRYTFENWIKLTPTSEEKKTELKLRYK